MTQKWADEAMRLKNQNVELLAALEAIMASMRRDDGTVREGFDWMNAHITQDAFVQARAAIKAATA